MFVQIDSAAESPSAAASADDRAVDGVDRPGERDHARGRDRRVDGELARVAGQRASRGVHLPAAAVAAGAQPSVRHDGHVAVLAGDPVGAAEHRPVDDERAADPGAERDDHRNGLPGGDPVAVFGPHRGVRVVLDDQRYVDAPFEIRAQRFVAPREVRREQHRRVVVRDPAGRADADGGDLVAGAQRIDDVDDHRLDPRRGPCRGCRGARGR